jgi:hypothetical protein
MTRTRDEILEARRKLKSAYGELFDSVAALLFRHDPVGINFEDNTDEYETETETILPRLKACSSEGEMLVVVHQEFVSWFDPVTAGPAERYTQIAHEIWLLWQEYPGQSKVL